MSQLYILYSMATVWSECTLDEAGRWVTMRYLDGEVHVLEAHDFSSARAVARSAWAWAWAIASTSAATSTAAARSVTSCAHSHTPDHVPTSHTAYRDDLPDREPLAQSRRTQRLAFYGSSDNGLVADDAHPSACASDRRVQQLPRQERGRLAGEYD